MNPVEMGLNRDLLVERVNSIPYYAILNKKANGFSKVTELQIYDALESFINSISSSNSRFDRELHGGGGEQIPTTDGTITRIRTFTASEQLGMKLYNENCSSCHSTFHKVS